MFNIHNNVLNFSLLFGWAFLYIIFFVEDDFFCHFCQDCFCAQGLQTDNHQDKILVRYPRKLRSPGLVLRLQITVNDMVLNLDSISQLSGIGVLYNALNITLLTHVAFLLPFRINCCSFQYNFIFKTVIVLHIHLRGIAKLQHNIACVLLEKRECVFGAILSIAFFKVKISLAAVKTLI